MQYALAYPSHLHTFSLIATVRTNHVAAQLWSVVKLYLAWLWASPELQGFSPRLKIMMKNHLLIFWYLEIIKNYYEFFFLKRIIHIHETNSKTRKVRKGSLSYSLTTSHPVPAPRTTVRLSSEALFPFTQIFLALSSKKAICPARATSYIKWLLFHNRYLIQRQSSWAPQV